MYQSALAMRILTTYGISSVILFLPMGGQFCKEWFNLRVARVFIVPHVARQRRWYGQPRQWAFCPSTRCFYWMVPHTVNQTTSIISLLPDEVDHVSLLCL